MIIATKTGYTVPECLRNRFTGLHKYRTRHIIELNAKRDVCIFCWIVKK